MVMVVQYLLEVQLLLQQVVEEREAAARARAQENDGYGFFDAGDVSIGIMSPDAPTVGRRL